MRRDQEPARSPERRSGLPVPTPGSRAASVISRLIRDTVFPSPAQFPSTPTNWSSSKSATTTNCTSALTPDSAAQCPQHGPGPAHIAAEKHVLCVGRGRRNILLMRCGLGVPSQEEGGRWWRPVGQITERPRPGMRDDTPAVRRHHQRGTSGSLHPKVPSRAADVDLQQARESPTRKALSPYLHADTHQDHEEPGQSPDRVRS